MVIGFEKDDQAMNFSVLTILILLINKFVEVKN